MKQGSHVAVFSALVLSVGLISTIEASAQAGGPAARQEVGTGPRPGQVRREEAPAPITMTGVAGKNFREALSVEEPDLRLKLLREVEPLVTDSALKKALLYPSLVDAYVAVGDVEDATKLVEKMVTAMVPTLTEADARISLARGYLQKKRYDLATLQLNSIVTKLKSLVEAKTPPTAKYLQRFMTVLELQGEALLGQGEAQNALTTLQEFQRLRESKHMEPSARVFANVARAYAKLGLQDEASASFAAAYSVMAHRVNAINHHIEVTGRDAAGSYLKELSEQENLLAWIKSEALPVYGSRDAQKPLDSFLNESLQAYDKALISDALRKAKADKPAPDFHLSTLIGKKVKLSELRGKVVLLNFWDTSCKPCRVEYPHLQKIQEQYRDKGLVVLMVNLDTDGPKVKPFAEKYGFTTEVLLTDGSVQHAYEVGAIPHTVIIDKTGNIRFSEVGFTLDTPEVFRALIASLLAESEITLAAPTR